jgi:hypothetical protein
MTCASFDAAMHNQKSRNKFHSPILDIQSNKLAITARATNRGHVVVLNEIVHRKLKRSATACRKTVIEAQDGRHASGGNRDGSDSRAVHFTEPFREAPMMAERLHSRGLVQHDRLLPDRKLRNRIIIGNTIAWVTIAILVRLIFF